MSDIYTHNDLRTAFPYEQYNAVWNYSNRMVLSKHLGDEIKYLFFERKQNGAEFHFICSSLDFSAGLRKAKLVWNPRNDENTNKTDIRTICLDTVQNVVLGKLKKGKTVQDLEKEDFTFTYFTGTAWQPMLPPLDVLEQHHLILSEDEQNVEYLELLRNPKMVTKRQEWLNK